ncbi:MAG TPA: hypothetical protein VGQ42_13405 [Candidatus Dormibacteraeota bacterium]|jgi:hypothetical protein|nr:hypothetical protein [Candidatus Dormibacteraeota bacterium]
MPDHKIHLDVRSTAGSWQHPFDRSETAQTVLNEGIRHFHLQGPGGYILTAQDGTDLPLSKSLAELPLSDGSVVLIKAAQPQDGWLAPR